MNQHPKRLKKIAIFDVDGTIFRSSLLIELVNAMLEAGIFRPSVERVYMRDKRRWLDREGDYESYIESVVAAFRKNLKGVRYRDFEHVAKRVVALHQNHVYRFTRDLVRDLKKKGYYVVAVSHSPKTIVKPFTKHLGFHKTYGKLYEINRQTGEFSGKALYENIIMDKAVIMEHILESKPMTLTGSVGVGDTESDIPFLRMVDYPICFNPNRKLFAVARRRGWEIVVERKDVIYKIKKGMIR